MKIYELRQYDVDGLSIIGTTLFKTRKRVSEQLKLLEKEYMDDYKEYMEIYPDRIHVYGTLEEYVEEQMSTYEVVEKIVIE